MEENVCLFYHLFFHSSSIEVGSKCLARYHKDHLWYPAEVDAVDKEDQKFTVKYESYGDTADLGLDEILPRGM